MDEHYLDDLFNAKRAFRRWTKRGHSFPRIHPWIKPAPGVFGVSTVNVPFCGWESALISHEEVTLINRYGRDYQAAIDGHAKLVELSKGMTSLLVDSLDDGPVKLTAPTKKDCDQSSCFGVIGDDES